MTPTRYALQLQPKSRCDVVSAIHVELSRAPGGLSLRYLVTGDVEHLRLPLPATPERTDELWKHTCFEAFVRESTGTAYREFNFAPSTQWAAYDFDDYRSGMRDAAIDRPHISAERSSNRFALQAAIAIEAEGSLRLNLTVVAEEKDGTKSYWALAHPPEGPPDFHHPDCFVLELPPATRA